MHRRAEDVALLLHDGAEVAADADRDVTVAVIELGIDRDALLHALGGVHRIVGRRERRRGVAVEADVERLDAAQARERPRALVDPEEEVAAPLRHEHRRGHAPEPPRAGKTYDAASAAILSHDATRASKALAKGLASPLEYVKALGAIYERVVMWGLAFDDRWSRIAHALGKGAFADGTFADHVKLCEATGDYMLKSAASSLYYVAMAGAPGRGDRALFAKLRGNLRTRSVKQRGAHGG